MNGLRDAKSHCFQVFSLMNGLVFLGKSSPETIDFPNFPLNQSIDLWDFDAGVFQKKTDSQVTLVVSIERGPMTWITGTLHDFGNHLGMKIMYRLLMCDEFFFYEL